MQIPVSTAKKEENNGAGCIRDTNQMVFLEWRV
jgi:hypothetical protein